MLRVYLVPGFFGFANLGELPYFSHVKDFLGAELSRLGFEAEVLACPTRPTASLGDRALQLLEGILDTAADEDSLHLVGHSSGGLDARLLTTPGAKIGVLDAESVASRVRSVVTVSTPHRGTPLASFFLGLFGAALLRLLSLSTMYAIRFGHIPLGVLAKVVMVFTKLDDLAGLSKTVLDQVSEQLLNDFSPDRRAALEAFLSDVGSDQALLAQLAPDAMHAFNAATGDRANVRYGSVITWAREPGLGSTLAQKLDPYAHSTHAIYAGLHTLCRRMPAVRAEELSESDRIFLQTEYGELPNWQASDGVVPTLSQVWGDPICAVRADHLDVIGHFPDQDHVPPHYDWLASSTGFSRADFEMVWSKVAEFIAATERARSS